ncbi:MAG: tetratricopeptide repeat protein, partial [Bacteroidota bacterium]|nr:tetratricopeptide repeat protein [Bacteroidota bacterium]
MGPGSRHTGMMVLITVTLILSSQPSFTQDILKKPSRQAAMEAFNRGDYENACREFGTLLQSYPKDPLYKYYTGVCLVKLNSEPGKASAYLQDAIGGSLDIKSIPDDAWFWLGRSQQMEGKYTDAVKSYKVFADKAGRKAARTYDVDGFIEECNQGTGKLAVSKAVPAVEVIPAEVDKNKIQTSRPQAQVHQGLPAGNDKLLAEAMTYQVKADSLN